MILKRLIVISVVFALVAGTAFAVDLSGEVIGEIDLLQGSNAKDTNGDTAKPTSDGSLKRVRLEGSGANDADTFGGWLRVEGIHWSGSPQFEGVVWWKPIDQFKLSIGGNPDGFYAKEGHTAWMFYQRVTDTGLTDGGNSAWGGGRYGFGLQTRHAFYGGFDGHGLMLDIKPVDVLGINIAVPFIDLGEAEPKGILKRTNAQIDVNLDFGNIALSYVGNEGELVYDDDGNPGGGGQLFLYFGLSAIENLGLDVGLGFTLPVSEGEGDYKATYLAPIAAGLGVQYGAGDFGIKARLVASFGGNYKVGSGDPDKEPLQLLFDVLPNYRISDNLKIFFSLGLGIVGSQTDMNGDKIDDSSQFGFHINPYIWVGEEWGPSFWAGFKLDSAKIGAGDAVVTWSVPIAIGVSF